MHPKKETKCQCHYEGRLLDGTVFDSSYKRGQPTGFAPNQVIPGWTEAMQLMVEGDKWELYIPSELAYGERGAGSDIPGGATLIFQMEIVEIQGEGVPALNCEIDNPKDGCNDKEMAYLQKMKAKTTEDQQKQLNRLQGMKAQKMAGDLMDWINRRIHILQQLAAAAANDDDDDDDD
eukprot:CAMPEP_0118688862 /NCGR_PEP_ID=MMETSP0800-20121206/9154_1 /TAXON_ID=210618 ORGANISM="Striatella unipunctata, Strain CCMP2910" /NCGR_SAMPLE_ID=MMETSP0800 /ASSEMBLY_ACC=CAM_ASM_000638 /LENGTH=176 /DNA_ID=CAMNT_0006586165 /DNA_START=220 /DNA_END=748 /DNA_ORIENTATION=+